MILLLLAAMQAVPSAETLHAHPPIASSGPQTERLSLVIARTGTQTDPHPAPCGADGSCGDSYFRSTFDQARTLAGAQLPSDFEARMVLHTPFMSRYTLALIVVRRENGTLDVVRKAGFHGRTGIACFNAREEFDVDWRPEGDQLFLNGKHLCVSDPSQIDPRAPKL